MSGLTAADMLNAVIRMTRAVENEAEQAAAAKGYDLSMIKSYTDSSYQQAINDTARLYWKEGSRGNFLTRMNTLIKFGLTDAWNAGAAEVGVEPDEMSQEDKDQIAGIIADEKSHVSGLLDFLDKLANDRDASLSDAQYRLNLWGNRYQDVVNRARLQWGGRQRFVWTMDPEKDHCHSGDRPGGVGCANLAGIVAFGSDWDQAGIRPGSSLLSCNGLACGCELKPTNRRRSPRALQKLLDIMAGANL